MQLFCWVHDDLKCHIKYTFISKNRRSDIVYKKNDRPGLHKITFVDERGKNSKYEHLLLDVFYGQQYLKCLSIEIVERLIISVYEAYCSMCDLIFLRIPKQMNVGISRRLYVKHVADFQVIVLLLHLSFL